MENEYNVIRLNPKDNIAVALRDIKEGEKVRLSEFKKEVLALRRIPYGHKIALNKIKKGDKVIKYGECMGMSTQIILIGDYVHVQNVRGLSEEEHLNILHNYSLTQQNESALSILDEEV